MASEGKQLNVFQKIYYFLAPNAAKDDDGRDNFNSRAEFVLAAMGGAVGLGNLLRFPSVVYNNYGLQFFIPYFIALFLIGIPILCLELCIGQAYRGGCVTAWNNLNHRARGVGFSMVFNGFSVVGYYVPLLAWAMTYFRLSFQSPLPWTDKDTSDFFYEEVVRNPFPTQNEETGWMEYPGTGMVGETAGWSIFIWALVFMCMYKGVGLTGRAMWITMALPILLIFILCIRSLSLPNASDGFRLYLGVWRSESLRGPGVWQDSFGQMFFSIGVGFGYFVTYASYSSKFSNSVQDAFIIACANSAIEITSALAVMGVVGFLGFPNDPEKMSERLNTFSSGFFYYPLALSQLPGANFFSALFFATLMLLGLTCAFALFEVLVTLIMDSTWGSKIPRHYVAMGVFLLSVCTSLIYCSEVGFFLLDAVDGFVNDLGLFFLVWCETFFATTLYRWRDPVDQIGLIPYVAYNGGFFLAHFLGLLVAHLVSAEAGAGVGFGVLIVGALIAMFIGKTPTVPAPSFWGKNAMLSRFWYAAFYSGQQLRKDLNRVVVTGKNWSLHWAWPVILKYITGPAVGIVFSFAYTKFRNANMAKDPPYLYAFILFHMVMLFILVGVLWPRFFSILIHEKRIDQGIYEVQPQVTVGKAPVRRRIDGDIEDHDSSVMNEAPRTPDLVGETTTVTNEKSQI